MGAPQPVSYGGLVVAQVRHFDSDRERPGLPPGVGALVERVDAHGVDLTLANAGSRDRQVVVQAGASAEHEFRTLRRDDGREAHPRSNAAASRSRTGRGSRCRPS